MRISEEITLSQLLIYTATLLLEADASAFKLFFREKNLQIFSGMLISFSEQMSEAGQRFAFIHLLVTSSHSFITL